jgi:hypothetical protein
MLHVSSFSSCTFLHTQIPNMAPWLSSMVHNISIDYSCAPNKLLSKELCPLEVNWCQNFTLTVFSCNFLIRALFCARVAHWIALSELFYLSCKDKVYLGTLFSVGFDCLKMSFRASKSPQVNDLQKYEKFHRKLIVLLL